METPQNLAQPLDDVSAEWVRGLTSTGPDREAGLARLHDMLVRVAVGEMRRREAGSGISGPELDDLAHQAAADAMLAILAKLGTFRGESRFTTWAYRFVVLEVSAHLAACGPCGEDYQGLLAAVTGNLPDLPGRHAVIPRYPRNGLVTKSPVRGGG